MYKHDEDLDKLPVEGDEVVSKHGTYKVINFNWAF